MLWINMHDRINIYRNVLLIQSAWHENDYARTTLRDS